MTSIVAASAGAEAMGLSDADDSSGLGLYISLVASARSLRLARVSAVSETSVFKPARQKPSPFKIPVLKDFYLNAVYEPGPATWSPPANRVSGARSRAIARAGRFFSGLREPGWSRIVLPEQQTLV
ncbi:MAG: hypothetical protein ACPG4T_15495, partial [Nannocystaceae bacterium]